MSRVCGCRPLRRSAACWVCPSGKGRARSYPPIADFRPRALPDPAAFHEGLEQQPFPSCLARTPSGCIQQ